MKQLIRSDIENLFLKVMDLDATDKSEIIARIFGAMEACHMHKKVYYPHDFFKLLESFVEKDTKK